MAIDDKLPGLTLYLDEAKQGKESGIIRLRATVHDQAVWDAVIARIDGHKIYAEDGLAQTAVELLKEDLAEKDKELARAKHEAHERSERLEAENSQLRQDNAGWAAEVRRLTESVNDAYRIAKEWQAYAEAIKTRAGLP